MSDIIYLDNAATTKIDPEVLDAMMPYLTEEYGNASSSYALGHRARAAIDKAREQIAALIHADPEDIYFTSGATESNNMALAVRWTALISSIEHPSVYKSSYDRRIIGVGNNGIIHENRLPLNDDVMMISIMYANNEIGTIQPINVIGEFAHNNTLVFHTDATQAFGHLPIYVKKDHIDMLSASAHKIYGPKGVGILYSKKELVYGCGGHGGHQEKGVRPGTENVAGIVGFGKAAELAAVRMDHDRMIIKAMRDYFVENVTKEIPGVELNGDPIKRLPNNASLRFDGIEAESLLVMLDMAGICASAGSACTTGVRKPSRVLKAIGLTDEQAMSTVRFTFGRDITYRQIDYTIETLKRSVETLRKMQYEQ